MYNKNSKFIQKHFKLEKLTIPFQFHCLFINFFNISKRDQALKLESSNILYTT